MHELVIRGGTVVDGTGRTPRTADVIVDSGRVTEIGRAGTRGRREIDADGLIVAPGWIDIHTHYDGQAMWDPLLETSSSHGVTTAVMGNCGVGFAPVRAADRAWTIALMEGVEDIPRSVFEHGLEWDWESFPQYLEALDARPRVIDVAAQVPHAPLRVFVMGERGIDHTQVPTESETDEMGRLAAEAIEAGAVGFSTSRSRTHVASDGRPIPSLSAAGPELIGIAKAVGHTRRGVFELVFEDGEIDEHLLLARYMCQASGRGLSLITLQRPGYPADAYRDILHALEDAQSEGIDMRGQVAPRPIGVLMSLGSRLNPLRASETFMGIATTALGHIELAKPEVRDRILEEAQVGSQMLDRFPFLFKLGDPPRYDQSRDEDLRTRAVMANTRLLDLVYEILVAGGTIYAPAANFIEGNYSAIREMLVHPLTVPGLSDAGAHSTVIGDFDFPTFLLSHWSRDVDRDQRLPIEWIVKRQSADTAKLVGLTDRGTLLPGRRADVNLIDIAALGSTAPQLRADLPGGASRLVGHGTGYVATLLAGQVIFERGQHTGLSPGRVARPEP
jgi:N-acyl-D-aspartate/D-glutamate deacylase